MGEINFFTKTLIQLFFLISVCFSILPFVTEAATPPPGPNYGYLGAGAVLTAVTQMDLFWVKHEYANPDGTIAIRYVNSVSGTWTLDDGSEILIGDSTCNNPPSGGNAEIDLYYITCGKAPAGPPPPAAAIGFFDVADPTNCRVQGWALDPDNSSASIDVHVYKDAPAGSGTFLASCNANVSRADVNATVGVTGNHGFNCALPNSYRDGGSHALYIHAIDINGTPNSLLKTNGKVMSCATPSVSLSASDCVIPQGGSACLTYVSYAFYNTPSPRQVYDLTTGVLFANADVTWQATNAPRSISYGTHTIVAQGNSVAANNGIPYAYAYPTASCAAGTTWDGKACKAAAFGSFDSVDQNSCSIAGWAIDMDSPSQSIDVHVYKDNSGFSGGTFVTSCRANTTRADVNAYLGVSGNHGFSCVLPTSYMNTGNHDLYIHAIDTSGAPNNLLSGNPKALNCAAAAVITATNCEIASGATSCNTTINWQFTNAPNAPTCSSRQIYGVNQTTGATTLFSNCTNPGTNVARAISHGTHKVSARYNGTEIAVTPVITASCVAGTAWNGVRCIPPPTITLSADITQFPGAGVPVTTTITAPNTASIAPGARVRLVWTSINAASCTNNFGAAAVRNGNYTDNSYDAVPASYSVTCTNVAGTVTASINASVPEYDFNFITTKELVRIGQSSSLAWDIKLKTPLSGIAGSLPYTLNCALRGAASIDFTTPAKQKSTIPTQILTNGILSNLTCTEPITGVIKSATVKNEVIPLTQEI